MQMRFGCPKGFTLVEMIVTLIIVALIAAVSGPRFFNLSAFQESGFFDETVSAVRYAQKYAVATGCPVRVQITATGFTLYRPGNVGACQTGPYNIPIADPSGNATTFIRTAPSGVTFNPTADFIFTASGTAILLTDPLTINIVGSSHLFRVFGETGFVQRQ
ncbi:MAG: prepilin-type N-terminal cleavage/methylation domain-containing protein [Sulfuricaulis sp.]|uniref:GspH/FimT family pseudopilin n=1 Tax=Sulfuricaulis sp. TaxID=2003553 RepID=UPI0025F5867E|nr:GspH/FimT family pseudopilin [Sulfuricaulis sp.]MCR4346830.1 prepilin-type N-terminal cleavage/methylation domain-containing protein [Sulfuricaulis sp.]